MADAKDPAAELKLLFPDVDLEVRDPETGETVALTLREFRFREGLEAQVLARPLIDALADAFQDGGALDPIAIDEALAAHADLWLQLIARATGRDAEWLAGLADGAGEDLSDAMWSANGVFFTRRVVAEVAARMRKETRSPSPKSSTPSCAQDTGGDMPKSPDA